ncbi:PepSY-associated TM helix domain-containing protein [uncultured Pluralibacter sp.]|uniref:PepSY-associated TM helix domain-containing protein n=1 Tax=uncultured Pluralibacter sp. TaxID=1490864 RepID=UPI0026276241|nr:PepSY-associated TM helix domain-containing protein [uncultured Pluralibacter sp.]
MTTCTPRAAWINLLRRLHFSVGLFVGPFIFIAALTGTLYVATPQLENIIFHEALTADGRGEARPLADQIAAAQSATGDDSPLYAVRPAPEMGETTRVMFRSAELGASESRALFIDPVTLAVKGDMTVYGTSGVLPLRMWIDKVHRALLLGDYGRVYSELAASWMWIAACGGIALWFFTRPRRRINNPVQDNRRLHVTAGWLLLVGMLLFSATGLTWSQWAGGNVDRLRASLNWMTPQVNTRLDGQNTQNDPHADHHQGHGGMVMPSSSPALYDAVLQLARRGGIDASKVEIRPPKARGYAWTVTEVDRSWPTRVDAVAVDADTMQIVDRTRFADFPLMAKLTRWGVDFHMGVLFGLANQLLLIAFGLALCGMILVGYRLWWIRRPSAPAAGQLRVLTKSWLELPAGGRVCTLVIAVALGIALPVMGASLLLFVVIDVLRWRKGSRGAQSEVVRP